jgi:programmed cell death protein 5
MDTDLAQARAQAAAGGGQAPGAAVEEQMQKQQQQQAQEEQRKAMLLGLLDEAARARLARIAAVKPDKAQMVENYILMLAQKGQISGTVTESKVIEILDQLAANEKATKVVVQRRAIDSDEDDDNDDDLM